MKKCFMLITLVLVSFSFILFPSIAQGQALKKAEKEAAEDFPLKQRNFLNLTVEQKAKLDEFRKMHQEESKEFLKNLREIGQQLNKLLRDPKSDQKEVEGLIDQLSTLRAAHLKKAFQHRRELRKIFTPEQLEKLEKFSGNRMAPRRGLARMRFFSLGGFRGLGRLPMFRREGRNLRRRPFFNWRRWW